MSYTCYTCRYKLLGSSELIVLYANGVVLVLVQYMYVPACSYTSCIHSDAINILCMSVSVLQMNLFSCRPQLYHPVPLMASNASIYINLSPKHAYTYRSSEEIKKQTATALRTVDQDKYRNINLLLYALCLLQYLAHHTSNHTKAVAS